MRFLLVDDSRAMRHIQRTLLESLGSVEFAEAADGVEALALISKAATPFDLILIDWNMPNMDDGTLVGRIRQKDAPTHNPVRRDGCCRWGEQTGARARTRRERGGGEQQGIGP